MGKEELLQKIKDEVAHEYGFSDWEQLVECDPDVDDYVDEIANLYAIAMCEEQKMACCEEAEVDYYDWDRARVDKQSILQTKNVAE